MAIFACEVGGFVKKVAKKIRYFLYFISSSGNTVMIGGSAKQLIK